VKPSQSRYVCQACGDSFLRWEGQCRACGAWNTLVETLVREASSAAHRRSPPASNSAPVPLANLSQADVARIPVGIGELDRVLGGGLVPGSLVLVGGEPGIGKSTLLLQAAAGLSRAGSVMYATGEESGAQVRLRAARL
jgi:DNA repair protein RadA/Sms